MFRWVCFAFSLLVATYADFSESRAHEAARFSIDGVYGDRAGCHIARGGKAKSEGGIRLSSKGYFGYEWQCKFVWAHKMQGEEMGAYHGSVVWSVITLCAAEGEAYTQLLSIQKLDKTVTIGSGGNDPVILNRCE